MPNVMPRCLVDRAGKVLARLAIADFDDGWYYGTAKIVDPEPELRAALVWYDEVVEHQMLSYLDSATAAVERFGIRLVRSDGSSQDVTSLHLDTAGQVSFRLSPIAI